MRRVAMVCWTVRLSLSLAADAQTIVDNFDSENGGAGVC